MGTIKKNNRKNTTKPVRQDKRGRYMGLTKISPSMKLAFVSKENIHGWSLGLVVGKRFIYLTNVRFASKQEVKRALRSAVAFIEKKKVTK